MSNLATIAQAIAVVSACWAIISGVGAWKREFIGKRKIELAEETLATFFEVKDAIAYIRNPWSSGTEGSTRKTATGESDAESNLLDRGHIVFDRYESKKEIFVRFRTQKYRFMAVFGNETDATFDSVNEILNQIFSSASMLATHYWRRQGRVEMEEDEFTKHLDEMHKHEGIFWDRYSADDEVRGKLSTIQAMLEDVTRPCFEEPMKTYSLLTRSWFRRNSKKVATKKTPNL